MTETRVSDPQIRPLPRALGRLRGDEALLLPGSPYAGMIDTLRGMLDQLADARLDDAAVGALQARLAELTASLAPHRTDEAGRMFGRVRDVPGHGQVMCPAFAIDAMDATSLRGRVTFGTYFLGTNGAAHGGAVALLFDEVLGIPANMSVSNVARTAYLHVNYRSITPIGRELQITAHVAPADGRKRIVRGELRDGDTLCVDAEGLFVELRADQP